MNAAGWAALGRQWLPRASAASHRRAGASPPGTGRTPQTCWAPSLDNRPLEPGPATRPRRGVAVRSWPGGPWPEGDRPRGQTARPRTAHGRSQPTPRPAGGAERRLWAAGAGLPAVSLRESGQGPAFWAPHRHIPFRHVLTGTQRGAGWAGGVWRSPAPRAQGVGARRGAATETGRRFRHKTHVHEPWAVPAPPLPPACPPAPAPGPRGETIPGASGCRPPSRGETGWAGAAWVRGLGWSRVQAERPAPGKKSGSGGGA